MDQQEQRVDTGHVSMSVEHNSRGTTLTAKVVSPVGVDPNQVALARSTAETQLKLAMDWLVKNYGTPPVDVKVKP